MKKLIIIVVALVVLLGGAGAGLFFTGMLDPLLGKEEVAEGEGAEGEGEGEEDSAAADAEPVFVPMDPLAVPVIVGQRVQSQVLLTLSLQVADQASRNDVVMLMPRLRDAMLQELYDRPVVRNDGDGTIDIGGVKQRLLAVAHRIMDPEVIRDVLVIKAVQMS